MLAKLCSYLWLYKRKNLDFAQFLKMLHRFSVRQLLYIYYFTYSYFTIYMHKYIYIYIFTYLHIYILTCVCVYVCVCVVLRTCILPFQIRTSMWMTICIRLTEFLQTQDKPIQKPDPKLIAFGPKLIAKPYKSTNK